MTAKRPGEEPTARGSKRPHLGPVCDGGRHARNNATVLQDSENVVQMVMAFSAPRDTRHVAMVSKLWHATAVRLLYAKFQLLAVLSGPVHCAQSATTPPPKCKVLVDRMLAAMVPQDPHRRHRLCLSPTDSCKIVTVATTNGHGGCLRSLLAACSTTCGPHVFRLDLSHLMQIINDTNNTHLVRWFSETNVSCLEQLLDARAPVHSEDSSTLWTWRIQGVVENESSDDDESRAPLDYASRLFTCSMTNGLLPAVRVFLARAHDVDLMQVPRLRLSDDDRAEHLRQAVMDTSKNKRTDCLHEMLAAKNSDGTWYVDLHREFDHFQMTGAVLLCHAVSNNDVRGMQVLLACDATASWRLNLDDRVESTQAGYALYHAIVAENVQFVQMLLQAEVCVTTLVWRQCLHRRRVLYAPNSIVHAARTGNVDVLTVLVYARTSVSGKEEWYFPHLTDCQSADDPICVAAHHGHGACIDVLLGAMRDVSDHEGRGSWHSSWWGKDGGPMMLASVKHGAFGTDESERRRCLIMLQTAFGVRRDAAVDPAVSRWTDGESCASC
jgi:hypothetical protein